MAREVLAFEVTAELEGWGIDLAMSGHAAATASWAQVDLGYCDDEPDHSHIDEIGRAVCITAIDLVRKWPRRRFDPTPAAPWPATLPHEHEAVDPEQALAVYLAAREGAAANRGAYAAWLKARHGELDASFAAKTPSIGIDLWMSVLAGLLVDATTTSRETPAAVFADAIGPLLTMRKVTAWEEFRVLAAREVDRRTAFNATLLRRKLDERLGRA
jgi:hypothetical protein